MSSREVRMSMFTFLAILLSIIVTFQAVCEGASVSKDPVPQLHDDGSMAEEKQIEKRARCSGKEQDKYSICSTWKSKGFCASSSQFYSFMMRTCEATCKNCGEGCTGEEKDKKSKCSTWQSRNFCESSNQYYKYMMENCEATCKNCKKIDGNWEAWGVWSVCSVTCGGGQQMRTRTCNSPPPSGGGADCAGSNKKIQSCNTNPCSGCSGKEQDKHSLCPTWKSKGFCKSSSQYYNYMMKNCIASCGNCAKPTSTPKPTISVSIGGDMNACLQAHNAKRRCHGAAPLVWDAKLAQDAQNWANHLLKLGKMVHATGIDQGENLYASRGGRVNTCIDAMKGWYDEEEPKYNYNQPGFSSATGHFTQVVWKGTTRLGVAVAYRRYNENSFETFVVARYSPQGNYNNQFAQNVGQRRC